MLDGEGVILARARRLCKAGEIASLSRGAGSGAGKRWIGNAGTRRGDGGGTVVDIGNRLGQSRQGRHQHIAADPFTRFVHSRLAERLFRHPPAPIPTGRVGDPLSHSPGMGARDRIRWKVEGGEIDHGLVALLRSQRLAHGRKPGTAPDGVKR